MRKLLLAVLFALLGSSFLLADTYNLDKVHTSVGFTVSHLVISHVSGVFRDFNGTINYDAADPTKSSIDVHIISNSITTGDDKRMVISRAPIFLMSQNFPS